jgi:flagellar hook-associated protein 1 FlgK
MANLLSTGVSALTAYQRALTTTGHNIANVNTAGYSRQTVELDAREPERVGNGYLGTGVQTEAVRRNYDNFLADRYRSYTASSSGFSVYSQHVAQIDNLMADPDSGLSGAMQQYFNAVQDVATDPTSIPTRQVMLNEAGQLGDRFRSLNAWLNDLHREVNADFDNVSSEINGLAQSIAEVNGRITEATANGVQPNDLLDERDRLLDQLSELVKVSTVTQDNNAVNVFIGNGQALVINNQASTLRSVVDATLGTDERTLQIVTPDGVGVDVTSQLVGGKLGGLISFRNEVLYPTQDQLGRLAVAVAETTNALHSTGMDLYGGSGNDLFSVADLSGAVYPVVGTATVDLTFVDPAGFEGTEYTLDYTAVDGWAITPADTGQRQVLGFGASFTHDGLQIDITGAPAAGDRYILRPFRQAASAMNVLVTDPRAVAAADASAAPDGFGDNSNALAMANLQQARTMAGGTATFADAYGELVADVGTRARASQSNAAVHTNLAEQVDASRQAVSGVNLDEEAANLVKFQQAYQAAAQVISVASTLFDTLLGAVRR